MNPTSLLSGLGAAVSSEPTLMGTGTGGTPSAPGTADLFLALVSGLLGDQTGAQAAGQETAQHAAQPASQPASPPTSSQVPSDAPAGAPSAEGSAGPAHAEANQPDTTQAAAVAQFVSRCE